MYQWVNIHMYNVFTWHTHVHVCSLPQSFWEMYMYMYVGTGLGARENVHGIRLLPKVHLCVNYAVTLWFAWGSARRVKYVPDSLTTVCTSVHVYMPHVHNIYVHVYTMYRYTSTPRLPRITLNRYTEYNPYMYRYMYRHQFLKNALQELSTCMALGGWQEISLIRSEGVTVSKVYSGLNYNWV